MLVRGDLTDQEGSTTQVVIITNCLQYIYSKNTAKAGMEKKWSNGNAAFLSLSLLKN